jgi:hypothetical protein
VLSPLSPCFTPGVVFAEDIWSRASKTSSAEKETTTTAEDEEEEPGEAAREVDEVGRDRGHGVEQQQQGQEGEAREADTPVQVVTQAEEQASAPSQTDNNGTTPAANRSCIPGRAPEEEDDVDPEEDTNEEQNPWTTKLRRVSLFLPLSSSLRDRDREKRMSLPYLKGLWSSSKSRSGSMQSTAG